MICCAWLKLLGALSLDQLSLLLPQDFWLHLWLHKRLRYAQGPFMRTFISKIRPNLSLLSRHLFILLVFHIRIHRALISSFLLSIQLRHRLRNQRPILVVRSYFHFRHHKFLILVQVGVLKLTSATTTMRHAVKVIFNAGYPWFQITLKTAFILACALQDIWWHRARRLDASKVESAVFSVLLNWTNFVKVQLFGCSFNFILGYLILSYAVVYLRHRRVNVDGGVFGLIWLVEQLLNQRLSCQKSAC